MNNLIMTVLALLFSCVDQRSTVKQSLEQPSMDVSQYHWTKVLDHADWKASYNFQMFSQGDTLWTFHPQGNWFSIDGKTWIKSALSNVIHNLAFLDYVNFNGSIYGLGHFEGNIEQFSFTSEIYKTNNFNHWLTLSKQSNLPNRFFYHSFVFNNKMWIIGGEDKTTKYADIWNSTDGIVWTKQRDDAAFGKRSGSQVVQLNNKLFLLDNDVWSSVDGLKWTLETNEIVKGQNIFGYAAIVFDEKIWLLGCNRNGLFSSQVLISADGKHWEAMDAPWTPRGGIAAVVHHNKLYMTGGKYGGTPDNPHFVYSNDLWVLEKRTRGVNVMNRERIKRTTL